MAGALCTLLSSLPEAVSAFCLSSLLDDAVPSSTSESSALSRKRFTLQGLANLKGQKGKEAVPPLPSTPSSCGGLWRHTQPHNHISYPVILANRRRVDADARRYLLGVPLGCRESQPALQVWPAKIWSC